MENRKKTVLRAAGIAAAATATAAVTSYMVAKNLVSIALDREEPKSAQRAERLISGKQKENAFLQAAEENGRRLAARENETVQIESRDGVLLTGHWRPHPHAKRVIVAMHGWRSSWSRDFGTISSYWEAQECSVLYAEQRAQNNSGGDYMGFGVLERYDCLDWIDWVNEHCGREMPVYLCGISMGATTVLMAAGLPLPENVRGVMADCGFTSPHAIWKHVTTQNLHLHYGMKGRLADAMFRRRIPSASDKYSTVDALRESRVPILLVHGADDHFVPVEMSYENYLACPGSRRLLVVPGADHGMSYFADPEKYTEAMQTFWAENDGVEAPAQH